MANEKILYKGLDENGEPASVYVDIVPDSSGNLAVNVGASDPIPSGAPSGNASQNRLVTSLQEGTIKYAEWPAGSAIKYLTIIVWPAAAATGATIETNIVAKVALDPTSAAVAALMLAEPATSAVDCNFIPIIQGKPTLITLSEPLANDPQGNGSVGAIALLQNAAGIDFDVWIGATA